MTHQLEDDLGFLLARTHRAMRRWIMSELDPLGITYEQFVVLTHLYHVPDLSQTELAEAAFMDKTSLARMLYRMEEAELIYRESDEADSRVNRVNLTPKGRKLEERVAPIRMDGLGRALQGLEKEEVRDLKRMLNHVFVNMAPEEED
jgi:DNA-binding MarR family transcriptional regulator